MKKIKKLMAMLLALTMVLGMSVTVFAEDLPDNQHAATGTDKDKGSITVSGIDQELKEGVSNVKVTAYQIVKAKYTNEGTSFEGYESLYDVFKITLNQDKTEVNVTENDLNNIIKAMEFKDGEPTKANKDAVLKELSFKDNAYTTDELPVGSYLVMVTGAEANVYSPVVVSISYVPSSQNGNTTEDGKVDLSVKDGNAWVKMSGEPTVDKTATPQDTEKPGFSGTDHNSVRVGDTIDYQVVINPVPYYGGKSPVFKVEDTLSTGLVLPGTTIEAKKEGIKVFSAEANAGTVTLGAELAKNLYTLDLTDNDQKITVNFVINNGYTLNEFQGKAIVIQYSALVTENAKFNAEGNENDAKLTYSKDSNISGSDGTKTSKTYNYTFDLSAVAQGNATQSMLTKVGEEIAGTKTEALANAEFTLFTDEECTDESKYNNSFITNGLVKSGNGENGTVKGALVIRGLAAGTYYLKETKAPEGYSLNDHVFVIVVNATYKTKYTDNNKVTHINELDSYQITIDGKEIVKTVIEAGEMKVTKGDSYKDDETFEIKNMKLSSLPSTGGIGTTIFTIGGCAIMILAAGLYFASRRKSVK